MIRTLLLAASALALAPALALAGEVEVTQRDKAFLPEQVALKVGDTIVFKNEDPIIHNMFSRSEPNDFNLKLQRPGEDMRQTFGAPGEVLVRCAIHPKMKLMVTVGE
jgi:plastocyanin